ncbi:MAG: hypothetical protein DMG88_06775 [Acidobacteria bacterium]|nr:MAG: hypothetical protein DMG88_06775 [Acidobacteriota bacterium]
MLLPPFTSTPRIGGFPFVPLPAPPGPGYRDVPPRAITSEPRPLPSFPAPEPSPVNPLPGPLPRPMPVPPPDPPKPAFSPPDGDKANDPAPPLPGTPILEPGRSDAMIPVPDPVPPLLGGAAMSPTSRAPPNPAPRLPRP